MMSRKSFAKETTSVKNKTTSQSSADENIIKLIFGDAITTPDVATKKDFEDSQGKKKKSRVQKDIDKTIDYLKKNHGIITPSNFSEILAEERSLFYSQSHDTISLGTIDAIVKACDMWKPYITPESFHNLVCEQVKSMFRIHACAICYTNSGSELKAYIGNFAELTTLPPLGFSCSVNYFGKISVYGV